MGRSATPPDGLDTFDQITLDLRELRELAGPVSYAELVRRIAKIRLGRGMNAAAAIPARSTIYNAFQPGRTRMDTTLLRDIVTALGESRGEADAWAQRCRDARRPVTPKSAHESAGETRPGPRVQRLGPVKNSVGVIALVIVGGVMLNLLGLLTANTFKLTVYLDMVGALIWGYGVRRFAMGHTLSRFISLNLLTALSCSIVALPSILSLLLLRAAPRPQKEKAQA